MKTTWDLLKIYTPPATEEDFESQLKAYEAAAMKFVNKWNPKNEDGSIRDDYLKDPEALKEVLDEYEKWETDSNGFANIWYYLYLATSLDQLDPQLKARENKHHEAVVRVVNEVQFFTQRVAKVPQEIQDLFLGNEELKDYHHFLSRLFLESKYLLSEAEEKILTLKGKVSMGNWTRLTTEQVSKAEREVLNLDGKAEVKPFHEILGLIDNPDKKIRDTAAAAVNEVLSSISDIAEAEMNSILENKKIDDTIRKFERPDSVRHLSDDVELEVVDALRDAVTASFQISKDFYVLKAKLLGQDKLQYHERTVPIGKLDKTYKFEEAVDIVRSVFGRLSPRFVAILESFLDGRVDVYPKKGKDGGAFCTAAYKTQHSHILLNHNDKLNDVLTFAHELGHGIHFELMKKTQNSLNFGASMATAEVASTFMEDFVLQELSKGADDELKLAINMMKLNDDVSTIIRQVACYNLEMELHTEFRKRGFLSKKEIGEIFLKNMNAYMGDAVELSPGSENWWIYWSHLRYFFHVYSYASGLLISKSLQNSVKQDPAYIEKVIKFFEAGQSQSPRDIFLELGIDIRDKEFWKKGMDEVRDLLEETKELAVKLKLI